MGIDRAGEMKRAVFFDRDGVLINAEVHEGKPYPPRDLASVRIPHGAAAALGRLKGRGYVLLVITNQPDVRRGKVSRDTVERINQYLRAELPLDDVFTCYHDDADDCDCRKPKPGLLFQAARLYGIDLPSSYMIGDRWRDTDAGANAGCKTILIDMGYQEREPMVAPDFRARSLLEAVDWILKNDVENV